MKKAHGQKKSGEEAFNEYYSSIFGERWNSLSSALLSPSIYAGLNLGGEAPYYLDPASICAALTLPVGKDNLDLCAAPGGKTLVLCSLMDKDASLCANERSLERKKRLSEVVRNCLPQDIFSRVSVSLSDGAKWCLRETECFDSVLLDAPCSSERHVIQDKKYLKDWTKSRIKTLCMEQWALLSCACRLLRPGAFLLYATCALSREENDDMVKKALKKFDFLEAETKSNMKNYFFENLARAKPFIVSNEVSVEKIFLCAEETEMGFSILPDASWGAGPLFFSLIKRQPLVL